MRRHDTRGPRVRYAPMRLSQYPIATLRDVPSDAEVISHQLMLRAGMIRRLAAGLYSWLPMGLRTLKKVERIVREEMDRAGALELVMPTVQPAELWKESARWTKYGPELLRFKDRHDREFVYGPTHEEVITDIARRELRSYKQLPVNFYQIQSKFRDEIRPRFGVMRAREFIMKDAYSFHIDEPSLAQGYRAMYDAYSRIFTRLGLSFGPFRPTAVASAATSRRNSTCSQSPVRMRSPSRPRVTMPRISRPPPVCRRRRPVPPRHRSCAGWRRPECAPSPS